MNYRDYKLFAAGNYYHVFNRGIGKMDVFKDKEDWNFFTKRLREAVRPETMTTIVQRRKLLPEGAFSLVSYCLMPNHFHFLIRQNQAIPVGKMVSKLCTSYSKYFNKKYDRAGGLFQHPFKAIKIEQDSYLLWLSAYIHNNPSTAGLVTVPDKWLWGSYIDYINPHEYSLCDPTPILSQFKSNSEYGIFVRDSLVKIRERKDLANYLLD